MTYIRPQNEKPALIPQRQTRRQGVGVGTTSLLVIFTLLCLATLAFLSITTAKNSQKTSQRSLSSVRSLTLAQGEAAKILSNVDMALSALHLADSSNADDFYSSAASELASLDCQVNTETKIGTFSVPIDDNNEFVTSFLVLPHGNTARYTITAQFSRMVGEWAPEENAQLWTGDN